MVAGRRADRLHEARYDHGDLWTANADGTGAQALLEGEHDDATPSWSPDGSQIAFVRDGHVAVANADGRTCSSSPAPTRPTTGGQLGPRTASASSSPASRDEILVVDADGQNLTPRADGGAGGRRGLGAHPVTDENGAERYPRRDLLVRGGLIAGAAALAGAGGYVAAREVTDDGDATAAPAAEDNGPLFVRDPEYTNLTTFLLASHPRPVREAIERHRRGLDLGTELYLTKAQGYEEEARAAAADYLGTTPDQVALTDSTTMGVALAFARMRFEPGDEVLTTEHDFYATHESLRLREERDGVVVKKVQLYPLDAPETASADAIVSALAGGITPKTRALAVTWVHSSSGVKLPLAEIGAAVADANDGRSPSEQILLCVDGIHGFGPRTPPRSTSASTSSPPAATSGSSARAEQARLGAGDAWERVAPTIPTFDGAAYAAGSRGAPEVAPGALNSPGGFHSFEHRWALKEGFAVHADDLGGRAKVAATTHALATRLKEGLAEIDGVTVKTPMDETLSAGLVAVELDRFQARDAVDRLLEEHKVVASVTPYATEYLRFGPSVANTEADVDAAIAAVAAL